MTRKQDLPRVRYLRDVHSSVLQPLARIQDVRSRIVRREHGAFEYALAMDPTAKAIYLRTILRWLQASVIRFEDARNTRESLARFHADKHRLPIGQRDIGRFASPGDIVALLDPPDDIVVRDVPEEVMAVCEVEARGDGWILVRLVTTGAASWWAASTQWCTRHPDTARRYLDAGPLYVIATPKVKYQISHLQFMDIYDRSVTDAPELPTEALEAALHVLRGRPSADVTFFPDDIGTVLQTMLDLRAGRNANPARLFSSVLRLGGDTWSTRDGTWQIAEAIRPRNGDNDRQRGFRGKDEITVVRNGTEAGLTREALENGRQSIRGNWKREDIVVLLAFLRSEASRVPRTEGVHIFPRGHGMGIVGRSFLTDAQDGCLVVSGGERFAMFTIGLECLQGPATTPGLAIIDIDGPDDRRLHTVTSAEKLYGMPDRIRAAIRMFVGSSPLWPTLVLALGADAASRASFREWKTGSSMGMIVEHALMAEDRSAMHVEDVVRELLGWAKAESMLRLLGSLRSLKVRSFWQLRAAVYRDRPTAEDLWRCMHVFGAGFLLAALPDEECTDELVDALLDAGRGEVVNVLPARMITEYRLRRAWSNSASVRPILHDRIVSHEAYQTVLSMTARPQVLETWMRRRIQAGDLERMKFC